MLSDNFTINRKWMSLLPLSCTHELIQIASVDGKDKQRYNSFKIEGKKGASLQSICEKTICNN